MTEASKIADCISRKMSERRRQLRLSLQEIASRAGITKSHVWELEQGRAKNPTIETAVNVATALGVSLDYLTGLSTSEPSLHPEALRIACEVDALLKAAGRSEEGK